MSLQSILHVQSRESDHWLRSYIMQLCCVVGRLVGQKPSFLSTVMHVYHTPLPSILCKLVPYRWDIPFLMFCTFFSLLLLFALMPLYQPVCGNTYDNNVHQFRDPPARWYTYLSSYAFRICTSQ